MSEQKPKRQYWAYQNKQEGRLCGDCFKPIAVDEWCNRHVNGRLYHNGCRVGIPTIGDSLNSHAVQQLAAKEANAPRVRKVTRRKAG